MTSLRLWDRGTRRLAAVDGYRFPSGVRQRFAFTHPGLTHEHHDTVEAAVRQWFRLVARQPRAKLTMPSTVTGDYWREFRSHDREYGEFCHQVAGHLVPDQPAKDKGAGLCTAFRLAQQDEHLESHRLPLLFRVDRELAVTGARRYVADCGGHDRCYDESDALCLRHVGGVQRGRRGTWNHPGAPPVGGGASGCGMGCGGGCGGGG
jgi:hypothetical protein